MKKIRASTTPIPRDGPLLTLFFCCYGALAAPTILQSRLLVENAETQVESFLLGVENLGEKSIPVARIHPAVPVSPPGNRNLAERIQIISVMLPGVKNLGEKAIPEAVILKMAEGHPKSEYEHI
ncbi:uncharacterized protein LOC107040999 [Diachasma alloeum]|uniref:uncharacterized protein LOC107040999 n=1 Tax=Diachasma alloeum TaxID=454923 RepID=UPI00073821F0|nr:uncharacterized protein LOC107040999 [Diachasma alloeum]